MTNRDKLAALLRVKIYPRAGVDYADVVAEYLDDSDVVVQETGKWERVFHRAVPTDKEMKMIVWCSICGRSHSDKSNFCPNCGADMRKGENG